MSLLGLLRKEVYGTPGERAVNVRIKKIFRKFGEAQEGTSLPLAVLKVSANYRYLRVIVSWLCFLPFRPLFFPVFGTDRISNHASIISSLHELETTIDKALDGSLLSKDNSESDRPVVVIQSFVRPKGKGKTRDSRLAYGAGVASEHHFICYAYHLPHP